MRLPIAPLLAAGLSASAAGAHAAPPPPLPAEVAERTRARYVEAFERLTGERF